SAFAAWLARQRSSHRMGFYPVYDEAAERLDTRGLSLSQPSVRPVPRSPPIGHRGQISVRAPNVAGRPFVVVRCDSVRDQACVEKFVRAFCFRTVEQIVGATAYQADMSPSALKCMPIRVLGLSGWIAAESDDEHVLAWLTEELSAQRLSTSEIDLSLIEF